MLHDDAGQLVTVNYSLGCPSHRTGEPCGAPVAVPWVDFSQPAAASAWVDGLYQWVANHSVDGIALDGNPFDDEWVRSCIARARLHAHSWVTPPHVDDVSMGSGD